jgi:hypothetical protein
MISSLPALCARACSPVAKTVAVCSPLLGELKADAKPDSRYSPA